MYGCASHDKKGDNHKKGGQGGEYGPAQCFVDAFIDVIRKRFFGVFLDIFPDSVKDDNGIVQ